jgi:hypothetical protein
MRWFCSKIKLISHVALFALAIQFALSFGHFHDVGDLTASGAQSSSTKSAVLAADNLASQVAHKPSASRPAPGHDPREHQGDICSICAVMAIANVALLATPPTVLLPGAFDFSYTATTREFVRVLPVSVAFRPRAPPVS